MSIKGINITYKVKDKTILDNVSLEIKENEIITKASKTFILKKVKQFTLKALINTVLNHLTN